MPYTEFHYTPTGTGVISGKEVLEQTEDAINDLGGQISGDVQTAIDTANNALNTANTASADAQNAVNTANTAYTAATNAQNTANTAQNTASNALTAAQNAQNDVNALGNRVTTAENNISQNTSDISGLTTRMGTAEGNITTLQNDVITAQGTATSAQNTATMARQQAYVLRYSSTAITDNSTIAYSTLDNTDNIKADDKIIDVDGKIFSIVSVDSDNSTVTVGSALIDLAQDSDVVHKSGEESIIGSKRFGVVQNFTGYPTIRLYSTSDDITVVPPYAQQQDIRFTDKNNNIIAYFIFQHRTDANEPFRTCWRQVRLDGTDGYYSVNFNNLGEFYPENNNAINLGRNGNRWKSVYATNYYYGSNNVEFSTKFVTTDTAQTISGNKTWSGSNTFQQNIFYERTNFYHQNSNPCYVLKDTGLEKGNLVSSPYTAYPGLWQDKNGGILGYLRFVEYSSGRQTAELRVSNLLKNGALDPTGSEVNCAVNLELQPSGEKSLIPEQNNDINLGTSTNKWKTLNGVEPSSLSLPNLTNAVDISGYITDLTGSPNVYSPPANGYIVLRSTTANVLGIVENTTGMGSYSSGTNQTLAVNLPVVKNSSISIYAICSSLTHAKFIPCQGNI